MVAVEEEKVGLPTRVGVGGLVLWHGGWVSMTTHMAARSASMTTLLRHRGLRFGSDDDRSMISAGTAGRSSVFFFFPFRIARRLRHGGSGGGERKTTAQHDCAALRCVAARDPRKRRWRGGRKKNSNERQETAQDLT